AGLETNPVFVQVAAPNEIVANIAVDVRVGEHVGVITLCIPHMTLEPILTKLSSHNWFSGSQRPMPQASVDLLQRRVSLAQVPVVVELGSVHLSLREVLDLAPGDVVVLDTPVDAALPVYVGGHKKYAGVPGQRRGRVAVEIRH